MAHPVGTLESPSAPATEVSWRQRLKQRWQETATYHYRLPFLAAASANQLRKYRRIALLFWLSAVVLGLILGGLNFLSSWWFPLAVVGFGCNAIGRDRCMHVLFDWGPFVLFMMVYGWVKVLARWLEFPVHWHLAVEADLWLFQGVLPNVWVQEHFRYATAPWWEFILMLVYSSYFFMPYLVAVFIWVRSRVEFRRYITGFLLVSCIGFVIYTLVPAAPPWAAARCSATDIAHQPAHAPCMFSAEHAGAGSLLGEVDNQNDSPTPWVQRLTARAWAEIAPGELASGAAEFQDGAGADQRGEAATSGPVTHQSSGEGILVSTYDSTNLVAAIPSLHAGLTMFIAAHLLFAKRWRTGLLAVVYALLMAMALVFFAEHYVFDIILGWLLAITVPGVLLWKTRHAPPSTQESAIPA